MMTTTYHRRRTGLPVAIFSLEMTAESLGMQLLFDEAGVDMAQYKQGFKKAEDDKKLVLASARLGKANIWIDDSSGQTIDVIAGKARRMAKQYGIKLFVLDYLQLIETEGRSNDRVRELARVSNKIVALKKQLKVPWIVLAQMNRNIETAERERKPVMSDLKDCGAFEQDADVLLFTYKTPYKELNQAEDGQSSQQDIIDAVVDKLKLPWSAVPYRVDFIVAKNREGATGDCQMIFQKNLRHFEDWHLWKVKHGVEDLKAGEREKVHRPPAENFDEVQTDFPEGN